MFGRGLINRAVATFIAGGAFAGASLLVLVATSRPGVPDKYDRGGSQVLPDSPNRLAEKDAHGRH